jgi:hypothetical protein
MPEYDLTFVVVVAVLCGPVLVATLLGKGGADE